MKKQKRIPTSTIVYGNNPNYKLAVDHIIELAQKRRDSNKRKDSNK